MSVNAVWQVQEAKNRFSEMIEQALKNGPQVITRHGRAVVRVIAASQPAPVASVTNTALTQPADAADGFARYLLNVPKVDDLEVPVRRSRKTKLVLGG